MKGKICMITGANSGIGFAAAQGLAEQGARIVMVCRHRERGEEAKRKLIELTGNAQIELLVSDLSSQQSVRDLAKAFRSRWDRLDVLVNNAGGLFGRQQTSVDGFEMTFAVNYLAPFLLTHLLLDQLKASGSARIVNVASVMQAKRLDLEEAVRPTSYSSFKAYRTAKLAVIMMTYFMAERLAGSGITVNALHPGVIYTPQSTRGVPGFIRPLAKLFMSSPEQGARLILHLAASPEAGSSSGKYFAGNRRVGSTVPVSYDKPLQRKLYERSLQWTGLSENAPVIE
ncbi:SDR family oxidoreductase [Cohnella hongkongensis]|uniref:SDR family oxidoreductase n=1 Tax=Cohnella hongkongensis TaxID=178337 RepID=A0ABV9F8S6_9BACL